MRKKKALENCRQMWKYMADNDVGKDEAAKNLWPNRSILFYCWACEFTKDADGRTDCGICPLWPTSEHMVAAACEKKGSPYDQWKSAMYGTRSRKGRRKAALAVVALCDLKLMELEV